MPIWDDGIDEWIKGVGPQSDELLLKVIHEEANELADVVYDLEAKPAWDEAQADVLKEMCDVIFVIMVWCSVKGWDLEGAFDEVCQSNLSKLDGMTTREDGKILKGPNYAKPDMKSYI